MYLYTATSKKSTTWQPSTSDFNQWLYIDLTAKKKVHKIATLGSAQGYVSEYGIQISNDNDNWNTIHGGGDFFGGGVGFLLFAYSSIYFNI